MATIPLQRPTFKQEQEEFATVSTTLISRENTKFNRRPFPKVRSVPFVAKTSDQKLDTKTKNYYPYIPSKIAREFLPPHPYKLISLEEESTEGISDDIIVHELPRSIRGKKVSFIQSSSSIPSTAIPRSQSKHQEQDNEIDDDLEIDEVEPFWRGVFALPSSNEVIFSKRIEVKIDELPSWEPYITIDSYRLEDDDE